ncbi:hypothetical protein GCM10008935_13000 [Alkalibacillus silvisoli]|uniref:Uncharacterized protein n=1 Tax=Alkalibacillus silvisoli TaxID=392823 RepID=A0ABN0ZU77_9BACI
MHHNIILLGLENFRVMVDDQTLNRSVVSKSYCIISFKHVQTGGINKECS